MSHQVDVNYGYERMQRKDESHGRRLDYIYTVRDAAQALLIVDFEFLAPRRRIHALGRRADHVESIERARATVGSVAHYRLRRLVAARAPYNRFIVRIRRPFVSPVVVVIIVV